jgi:hypothetical protein
MKLLGLFGINGGIGLAALDAVEGLEEKTVPLAKLTTLFLRLLLELVADRGITADYAPGSKSKTCRGSGVSPSRRSWFSSPYF